MIISNYVKPRTFSWMFTVQRKIIVIYYFIKIFPVLKNKSSVLYIAP